MDDHCIKIPQMLLIGSTARNCGKTMLAAQCVRKFSASLPVIGLKVTSMDKKDGGCPHGGQGCGACAGVQGHFDLVKEHDAAARKDTSSLLSAGCQSVYWLRTLRSHIKEGIAHFLPLIPQNALILCESNSLRRAVEPGVFMMLRGMQGSPVKESARSVLEKADVVVAYEPDHPFDALLAGLWVVPNGASVRVLYEEPCLR